MQAWLVEVYVPRCRAEEAGTAGHLLRAAAAALSREGTPVRYVRTTLLPDDETCFHLLEAESEDAVARVLGRAGLGDARITAAVEAFRSTRPRER